MARKNGQQGRRLLQLPCGCGGCSLNERHPLPFMACGVTALPLGRCGRKTPRARRQRRAAGEWSFHFSFIHHRKNDGDNNDSALSDDGLWDNLYNP
jgi:hypothetical protein